MKTIPSLVPLALAATVLLWVPSAAAQSGTQALDQAIVELDSEVTPEARAVVEAYHTFWGERVRREERNKTMCWGNNSCIWIILILVILFCCGGFGSCGSCGGGCGCDGNNGCNNGCNSGCNNGCGC